MYASGSLGPFSTGNDDGTMTTELLTTGLSLIGLQLVSRLLTFILNQTLVRVASPEALGTASIQFEVLINTVLFFSREGVRGGLSRTQDEFGRLQHSEESTDKKNPSQGEHTSSSQLLWLC